jgi:uncharacterized membrane protein YiaA
MGYEKNIWVVGNSVVPFTQVLLSASAPLNECCRDVFIITFTLTCLSLWNVLVRVDSVFCPSTFSLEGIKTIMLLEAMNVFCDTLQINQK